MVNKMFNYIGKKTENIRYKFVSMIVKYITPVLFKKIDTRTFINHRTFLFKTDNIPVALRPSFIFMKKKFGEKLLRGAEIGVERGRNSKSILKGLNIEKLYLIDVWVNYDEIEHVWTNIYENYRHVIRMFRKDKRVEIIKEYSEYAVHHIKKDSLDFVYIDANHSYKYVLKDIEIWITRVRKGGIIAGHDVSLKTGTFYEVLEAVRDFCYENKIVFYVEDPDWYFIKHKRSEQ